MKLPEMIESFMKNDNRAFEYVYSACGSHCISRLMSKRRCSEEDAEDLFIDAVLIFREKLLKREIEYLTNLKAYLSRICDNNYLASTKKKASNSSHNDDIAEFLYPSNDFEINSNLKHAAEYSWNKLSEKCKDIIYLFYVEAISMKEIAKHLNLSNSDTAKSTKARCFKTYVSNALAYYEKSKDETE